jgi:hypothetical protein
MAQFGTPRISGSWAPIMQRLVDKPTAPASKPFLAGAAEEERELALLAQFMRHDSVASLAKAIATRSDGILRAEDLIAARGGLRPTRRRQLTLRRPAQDGAN